MQKRRVVFRQLGEIDNFKFPFRQDGFGGADDFGDYVFEIGRGGASGEGKAREVASQSNTTGNHDVGIGAVSAQPGAAPFDQIV